MLKTLTSGVNFVFLRNKCQNLSKLNKMVKNGQNSQKCPIGKKYQIVKNCQNGQIFFKMVKYCQNGQILSKWSNIVKW